LRVTIWGYPNIVGDVVLSTTLIKDSKYGQAREHKLEWKSLGVSVRSSSPPRKTVRNGVKNLHGNKAIPKSLLTAVCFGI
jgi:hypothetical protein